MKEAKKPQSNKELGDHGEELAIEHLKNKGYQILARNWRYSYLEVDIIAKKDDFLVIVEVKTRSTSYFGMPDEAVSHRKIDFLAEAAAAYQDRYDIDLETRFDIISILRNKEAFRLHHIEDAFHP